MGKSSTTDVLEDPKSASTEVLKYLHKSSVTPEDLFAELVK